jgi:hypothetical protein
MPLYKGGIDQKNDYDGLGLHFLQHFSSLMLCTPLAVQSCVICCFTMMMGKKARTLTMFANPL